jgi:hypothetical protein
VTVRLAAEFEREAAIREEMEPALRELAAAEPDAADRAKKELDSYLKELLEEGAADVRYRLVQLGRSCQRTGDRPGALRIAGYLYGQPNDEAPGVVTNLSSFRVELGRDGAVELKDETSPWDTPPAARLGRPR